MAFGNFWRGRERFGGDREREREPNRDRWRTSSDWREEGRNRDEYGSGSSGEYYGERSRDYGGEGYAGDRYGSQYGSQQRYGSQSGRDWEQGRGAEQGRGSEQDRDWRSQYSSYGRDYERDYPSRSSYGAGSEGSDWDYVGGGQSRGGRGEFGRSESGRSEFGRSDYGQATQYGQGTQQHRGKGPRGYRRSDERIREDLCDCLTDDPFLDASEIEVKVESCEVILTGSVSSRDDKRRAEDLAESISGVNDVRNNLRVTNERSSTSGQSATGQTGSQTAGQRGTTGQQGQTQPGQTQPGQTQQGQQSGRH
jgi:osmotically-inducible protein OsmY